MKKLISLMLCTILLTACGSNGDNSGEIDTPEITPAPQPQIEPTPEPQVEPTPQIEPELTDFTARLAALEPYEQRTEIYSRLYPQTVSEFIPADNYGKIYPFPAVDYGNTWDVFYGFMTADGAAILDGTLQFVFYADIDDGYYRAVRFVSDLISETVYVTADGSKAIAIRGYNESQLIGDGKIRVFRWNKLDPEDYDWDDVSVGVIDMDGNIVEPFEDLRDYAKLYLDLSAQYGPIMYVNKATATGDYFISFTTPSYFRPSLPSDYSFIIENVAVNDNGEIVADFVHTPSIKSTQNFISPGVTIRLSDNLKLVYADNDYEEEWLSDKGVNLVDNDNNLLMHFPLGVVIRGGLIVCEETNFAYDFDLNQVKADGYEHMLGYAGNDGEFYIFDNGAEWDYRKYALYHLPSGTTLEFSRSDEGWNFSGRLAAGVYIIGDTVHDMNTGETYPYESLYPADSRIHADIDEDGLVILFINPNPYIDGEWLERPGGYGLYTDTGEEILPIKYERLEYLGDGLYEAWIDNYMGVIRANGEWIIKIDRLKSRD